MARICHIDANGVDALRVWDFFNYMQNVDEWLKHEQQREQGQQ